MTGQAWALLLLKWQLFRNTLNTSRLVGTLASVVVALLAVGIAIGAGVGLYLLGARLGESPDSAVFLLVMDVMVLAFCALIFMSLFSEIQRQDQFDFRTLLHLPISLSGAYLLNFGVSLFGHALVFLVFGGTGFMFGLSRGLGAAVWWGLPLMLLFYVMVMAWVYHLRGMIAIMLINRRKRRVILTMVPVFFILVFQMPYLLSVTLPDDESAIRGWLGDAMFHGQYWLEPINQFLPPGWLPYAYQQALLGEPWRAVAFGVAMALLGLLGILLGYRSTVRFYLAGGSLETGARGGGNGRNLTGWRIPLLDGDTAAMTCAAFLSYLRHPNIRMMLVMPLLMGGVILVVYHPELREKYGSTAPNWMPLALLLWPYFNFTMIFFNLFGIDGHGFRGLMLLPTPRHKLLFAKNIALFPFVAGVNLLFVALGHFLNPFTPTMLLMVFVHIFVLFFTLCIPGNFLTLYLPYRIGFDTMRQRGNRTMMFLVGLLTPMLVGLLFLPTSLIFLLDGFMSELLPYPGVPVGLLVSVVWLGVVVAVYRISLVYAGDLFIDREPKMLESLVRNLD